jgi:putative aldouronate transport system substrate-binding protein
LVGKYQQVGLITPIGDLIKDKKNIQKYCSDSKVSFTIDGKQYAFGPNNPRPAFSGTQIRKDWLLKAGFTKQPQTIDEFYNMLRTFKTKDFDGNGKDDTVPLALAALPDDLFAGVTWHLLRAMHNMPMNFLEKDGKIVYSLLEPQAKEFLKFANKLYIEGLIPKDFASLKAPDANELLLGNKAGVLTSTPWGLANNVKVVKEKYNGEIVYLDPPKSISGDKSYMPINRPIAQAVMVTKTCKDPKTAIDFMEMRFEEDLITLLNYGILNEHYTLINGKPIFTEKVVKGEIKTDWFVYFANPQPAELWHYNVSTNGSGFNETYSPQEKWIGKFFPADLYMPPQPKLKTIETELIAQVQKFYVDVITGNVKIDEFESARKKWLDAGGQDILEGYSKLYESLGKPKFSNVEIGKERDYKGIYMFDGKK